MAVSVSRTLLAGLTFLFSGAVAAQSALAPYVEHEKRLSTAEMVGPLKSDLFGDTVSLYNGSTEFAVTDVDLPGNDSLPVQLRRRFKVESSKEVEPLGGFGAWDLDVPYMYGTFDGLYKWNDSANGQNARCSQNWLPKTQAPFSLREIWHGNFVHMPDGSDREVLVYTGVAPSDGQTYTRGAKDFLRFRCKATTANGYPGEGFIAVDTDGTKYTFDVGIERGAGVMKMPFATRSRVKVFLMASRIEDRFGNYVTYQYTGDKLTSITASDGRAISITYSGNTIVKASANGRDWNYTYSIDGSGALGLGRFPLLSDVALPDGSYFTYQYQWDSPFGGLNTNYTPSDADPAACDEPSFDPNSFTMTIGHPSGAMGTFYFPYTRLHRSGTPVTACQFVSTGNYQLRTADYFDLYALGRKTIAGPGVAPQQWTYNYGGPQFGRTTSAIPCGSCTSEKTVVVTQPDGSSMRYKFGILYAGNEGRLLGTDTVDAAGVVKRSQTSTYVTDVEVTAMPFRAAWGDWTGADDAGLALKNRPIRQSTTLQDGVSFANTVGAFDSFARPVAVTKSNSQGYSRTEQTAYQDNLATWKLGQIKSVSKTAPGATVVMAQTDYDAADLPWRTYSFGVLEQTLTYYADGTLATAKDGKGNTTTLSNWKRGLPQTVNFADSTAQSVEVDNNGWIRSVTDENSYVTKYDYDAMGRLRLIDYPDNDGVDWANTIISFSQVAGSEYGIPPAHWKHSISTGNGTKVTYFDALWRPVVIDEMDAGDVTATTRQTFKRYDSNNRVVFQSYIRNPYVDGWVNFDSAMSGTRTTYDVLDRATRVDQDSELGTLTTDTEYLPGLQMRVTNPRRLPTTTTFMAYDEASQSWPVAIVQPEGVYTDIVRDVFGKPTAIKRRNAGSTTAVTRQFVYDGSQRLCKSIEPETGATAIAYDSAGNVDWSASGLSLTDPSNCNSSEAYGSGRRVQRSYDVRNRLSTLGFSDGNGNQSWEYWADGLVKRITTYNDGVAVTNDYSYNKRRLLTGEATGQADGETWGLGYGYNANGQLASLTYPSGLFVDYAPNALGQPTRAGSYATGVSYFPNGAMKQFTYGNGIVHSLTQNARGLPDRSRDAYGSTATLDDGYDYDANGNVMAISDAVPGNRGNRDMTYDDLDRLISTTSPMFSPASYSYDVLDNLKTVKVAGRDHTYLYDSANRLTNVVDTANGATVVGLGYDAQGNLSNRNGQAYVFDYGNRLRQATGKETYRYDGQGRRVLSTQSTAGTIGSMYGQDGVLRYQRNQRIAKAYDYITLNGSLVAQVSTVIAPAVPVVTTLGYVTQSGYTVQWSAVTNASSYEVQESTNGGAWQVVYSGNGLSSAVSGKATGSYGYRARACNAAGCGAWSATATVSVELAPGSPPILTVPNSGPSGTYTVSWGAAGGATSYTLEESFNSGAWAAVYNGGAQSKDFTGRAAGTYAYRIKACNPIGCSSYSSTGTVSVVYPPVAPSLSVPASSYSGSYSISWSSSAGATTYQVDENFNGGSWSQVHNAAATSVTLSGRVAGSYGYRVRACNSAGCSAYSGSQTVSITLPPTAAPSLTGPGSTYSGAYSLSWTGVAVATSYQLVERLNGGGFVLISDSTATAASVSGRGPGSWDYMARGCNIGGCGPWSNLQGVQVIGAPTASPVLSAPATSGIGASYTVSWTAVATATDYRAEESVDGGGWTYVAGGTSANFNKGSGGSYAYRAQGCNPAGCGPYSNVGTVSIASAPPTPTGLKAVQEQALLCRISWNPSPGATHYQLRFGTIIQYDEPQTQMTWDAKCPSSKSVRACNATVCSAWTP